MTGGFTSAPWAGNGHGAVADFCGVLMQRVALDVDRMNVQNDESMVRHLGPLNLHLAPNETLRPRQLPIATPGAYVKEA